MLKINRKVCKDKGVRFSSIKVGELFCNPEWQNVDAYEICMKINIDSDNDEMENNCVSLDDGNTAYVCNNTIVYKVTAELNVTSGITSP